ncbi:MAG: hypothetical protein WAV09_01600 [Minisyncoccia bacterium]
MPNPLSISDAADLVDVSIQDVWLKGSVKNTFYDQYYNVETGVTDYYMKDSSMGGLGYAGRIVENASVTAASPVQGFDKTYTQVQFGVLMSFTKMVWFFGIKKRKIEEIVNEARQAVADKREQLCADRLDQSYNTAYTVNDISGNYSAAIAGGDALAMISASHTREDGGTAWNNRITDGSTVNMDFEYDALKAAHRTAALVTGPTGKPLNVNYDTLIVSRGFAVHNRAVEILGALNKGWIPGSADRDQGAIPNYKIIALPWIQTNTSYWWMMDSSMKGPKYGLQYKESQGIEKEGPNVVFKTGEIQYKCTTLFDLGFNDARNIAGSKNTNAS